jgi:hypothetical protein
MATTLMETDSTRRCAIVATVSKDDMRRVRKLAQLPDEARACQFALQVTRLTALKSLCREAEVANRFVTYLAQRTRDRMRGTGKKSRVLRAGERERRRKMIDEAVTVLEQHLAHPSEQTRSRLWAMSRELTDEQNEHRRIHGGPVRIIKDKDLLRVEYAVRTVVATKDSAPLWAYQTARHYAERYDPGHGTGLTPASVPFLQDIVDFWIEEFDLDTESIVAPAAKKRKEPMSSHPPKTRSKAKQNGPTFTHRQGQFLAFIHHYWKLHRQGPAELDMVQFFRVTPPSVHGMVVKLAELGLVTKEPRVARSVRVAIPEDEIPPLEEVQAPPW